MPALLTIPGAPAANYFKLFMPALMVYVNDEDVELRQAAAYGLAVTCQHGGQAVQPYLEGDCS